MGDASKLELGPIAAITLIRVCSLPAMLRTVPVCELTVITRSRPLQAATHYVGIVVALNKIARRGIFRFEGHFLGHRRDTSQRKARKESKKGEGPAQFLRNLLRNPNFHRCGASIITISPCTSAIAARPPCPDAERRRAILPSRTSPRSRSVDLLPESGTA